MSYLQRTLARRLPFYYGWVIVVASFTLMFVSNGMAFWGLQVFVGPMGEDTGWARGTLMGALTLRWLVGGAGGLVAGRALDRRVGPTAVLLAGALVDGGSMMALYWTHSALVFVLLFGVVGGIGSIGTGRLVSVAIIPKWFVARRGMAMGIAATGSGVSALVMSPLANGLVSANGWREGWVWLGGLTLVLLLPFVPLIGRAPEDLGLQPDGAPPDARHARRPGNPSPATVERSYTLAEAMRTPALWLLTIGMGLGLFSMSTNASSMVPFFASIGFSPAVAASGLAVYGGFSTASRFLWGYVADRLTVRRAIIVQALLTAGGIALYLGGIRNQAMLYAVAAYQGLMLGGFVVLQPLIWPAYFGRQHLGAITGVSQFFTTFTLAAGPVFAGLVFDATAAYTWAYAALIFTWVACALVTATVRPQHEVQRAAAAPAG